MTAREFLELLWPDLDELGGWLLIWTLPDRRSAWFQSTAEAALHAERESAAGKDVYLQVSLSPEDFGPTKRCTRDLVKGIPGLWCEVDVRNGHHATGFDSEESALRFLREEPDIPPTVIVRTGGGFHAWWLFDEPWIFESEEDRQLAEKTEYGWWRVLSDRAAVLGQSIDAVWDLARVLRIPGTLNTKYGSVIGVSALHDGKRCNPGDLEIYVANPPKKATAGDGDYPIDSSILPHSIKFAALLDVNPQFKRSFMDRKKTAGMTEDSLSAYDFSHVLTALHAGWDPWLECPSLIWTFRQMHGTADDVAKGCRRDYITTTILKALQRLEEEEKSSARVDEEKEQHERIAAMVASEKRRQSGKTNGFRISDPKKRAEIFSMIKEQTAIDIVGVTQYGEGSGATYSITVDGVGEVFIGDGLKFMESKRWAVALLAKGAGMDRPAAKTWEKVYQYAGMVADVVVEPDTEEVAKVREWLRMVRARAASDKASAFEEGRPYVDGERLYFMTSGRSGLEAIAAMFERNISRSALRQGIRLLGIEKGSKEYHWDPEKKKSICRFYYSIAIDEIYRFSGSDDSPSLENDVSASPHTFS